jgi:integrase/recombinase XerD
MSTEAAMRNKQTLGPWIRRFLLEYLPGDRNLARNTQRSYRDAIRLLVLYAATTLHRNVDDLLITDIPAEIVRKFLRHIEEKRRCCVASRNQRLAAVHGLAAFIAERCPEHMEWCAQIRAVKSKPSAPVPISYLEKHEIDALLAAPDSTTRVGFRDHTLLLFLYNSGARADEAAHVRIEDLHLHAGGNSTPSSVRLQGKGGKVRTCPLWPSTTAELNKLISGRADKEPVFFNRNGKPLTRFGIHDVVTRHAQTVMAQIPEMKQKLVRPHVIRHTTATHLLRAGVDINTIRAWLGHVSINTTNIYAETDLDMKAKALGMCEMKPPRTRKAWRDNPDLMSFLAQL